MKYRLETFTGILITISLISLIGCGPDETPPELPNIAYKLVITDSIGVEIGDTNYILGWPVSLTHSPDGNIAFLDRMKHAAFIYTPEGEFIRTIGREGEGPGEFHMPSGLEFYSDGSLLIGDQDGIALFNSSYDFKEQMTWPLMAPSIITALEGGGFIGTENIPKPTENRIMWVSTLARWDDGDEEPSVEYFGIEYEWDIESPGDFSSSRESTIYNCATPNGRVFYSRSSIDEFVIHGCEPDGTPFLRIEDESVHRVRKSEQEIQIEIDNFTRFFNRMTGGSSRGDPIEPDPYKRIVLGMFVDGEDRLWVRLGYYEGIVFRVYDMSGEILFHAMLDYNGDPLDLISWSITGDEHGFLAINVSHEYYQRIYMLSLVET
ncbi:MAG: 6-bladed beta-propeller, partial [Candidatus Fermentibacteraceae bacterium]|nr:6-bladed beta-propeller [Candidatus Fermentibacteraceae bacterium]